jgi:glycine hydroxymethyltransferase
VKNAQRLAAELNARGYKLASRGTDNHLILVDLRPIDAELTGKTAALWLEQVGVIANMNTVPNESRSPMQTSGVRWAPPR